MSQSLGSPALQREPWGHSGRIRIPAIRLHPLPTVSPKAARDVKTQDAGPGGLRCMWKGRFFQRAQTLYRKAVNSLTGISLLFFHRSVMFDSWWPLGLQHTSIPCLSLSPGVCLNSCPMSRWGHPTISSSVFPPSPLAFSLSQHQGLFQWVSSLYCIPGLFSLKVIFWCSDSLPFVVKPLYNLASPLTSSEQFSPGSLEMLSLRLKVLKIPTK